MATQQYKTLILVVTVFLALFTASPAIQRLTIVPQTTHLTELSILGAYHNATYPYNGTIGQNYPLYIDVDNNLGSFAYYQIEVKFRNQTQSAPNSFNQTSSNLPSLGNISFCVANNEALELPINVSFFFYFMPDLKNINQLDMKNVILNGFPLSLSSTTITWDSQRNGFYGNLFFELWIFNDTTNTFQYDQRYVSLWLNMTSPIVS
ncbi:MAG: DUF1616 domain-containing protein [Candidatus Bathyarchaeia archaeon]|jgi:uncharacterized membrane protein